MNCQNDINCHNAPFRLVRLDNHVRRGFISSSIVLKFKTKQIQKTGFPKCKDRCEDHFFSLRRLQDNKGHLLNQQISEIRHRFCPRLNEISLDVQGGLPKFMKDNRIDTPAFSSQFDSFTATDDRIFKEKYERLIKTAKLANTSPQKEQFPSHSQPFKNKSKPNFQITMNKLDQVFKQFPQF